MSPGELEGDLKEWGEVQEKLATGLNALSYPSGSQQEFISGNGSPPIPDYYPNHKIQALDHAVRNLESKYNDILILVYILRLNDNEASKKIGCTRGNVPKMIKKAKHFLVISRYWRT